ncbi:LytTR family DNA-binding domain-containing protein [Coprobacillaceae bacterium CR2/5/TPMF4]|nr:LytTR family DNA-binding domain-containing protein [Coprobacillaceae bacterium CR2/5/TPMF4]
MEDSFGRNVYGYINKSKIDKLEIPLTKIYKELLENRTVVINNNVINLYKVYYVRADGPYINIHYENDYDIYRMTLSDFATRISNPNFIRTHKSYLVNMRYIKNIDQRIITLDNDVNVSISHGKRSDVMKTYHYYLMENISYD